MVLSSSTLLAGAVETTVAMVEEAADASLAVDVSEPVDDCRSVLVAGMEAVVDDATEEGDVDGALAELLSFTS